MTQAQRDIAQKAKILGDQITVTASHAAAERAYTAVTFQTLLDSYVTQLTQIAADFTPGP